MNGYEYFYFQNEPIAVFTQNKLYYVQGDAFGTPKLATDQNQQVVWKSANTAFGEGTPTVHTIEIPLRFPGQYYDVESGLHYNWHRYYDPEVGRYIEPDSIGLAGGVNLYTYVNNNPLRWVDPMGLASCTFMMSTGRLVCTPSNPENDPVDIPVASGNNSGGQQCRNNPACTAIPNRGPVPTGCWRWTNDWTGTPNGRVLEPCPETSTNLSENRTSIRTHSCSNPFGPGLRPPFCSTGCVTGTARDIRSLNQLIDQEPGSILQVVP